MNSCNIKFSIRNFFCFASDTTSICSMCWTCSSLLLLSTILIVLNSLTCRWRNHCCRVEFVVMKIDLLSYIFFFIFFFIVLIIFFCVSIVQRRWRCANLYNNKFQNNHYVWFCIFFTIIRNDVLNFVVDKHFRWLFVNAIKHVELFSKIKN